MFLTKRFLSKRLISDILPGCTSGKMNPPIFLLIEIYTMVYLYCIYIVFLCADYKYDHGNCRQDHFTVKYKLLHFMWSQELLDFGSCPPPLSKGRTTFIIVLLHVSFDFSRDSYSSPPCLRGTRFHNYTVAHGFRLFTHSDWWGGGGSSPVSLVKGARIFMQKKWKNVEKIVFFNI